MTRLARWTASCAKTDHSARPGRAADGRSTHHLSGRYTIRLGLSSRGGGDGGGGEGGGGGD